MPGADDIRYEEVRNRRLAHAYKVAVERELESVTPGTKWRAPAPSPDMDGGGGPGGDVVELVKPIFDAAATIADFLQVAWAMNEGRKLLKRLGSGREPLPNKHSAIVFAAQAIFDRTEVTDLTFAFSTTMLSRRTGRWVSPEGFTVGFRGPETLWLVAVNVYGGVLGITELPVPGTLPSAWDS
jgi:hypothetical protein